MPSNQFTCPECDATLRTGKAVTPGKKIRCPKCQTVFATPAENGADSDADDPDDDPRPRKGQDITAKKPVPARKRFDEDEDEDIEDRPRRRKKRVEKKSSTGLLIGLIGGGVAVLLIAGGVGAWAFGLFGKGKTTGTGSSEKTYTINIKDPVVPGKSVTHRSNDKESAAFKVFTAEGKLLKDSSENHIKEEAYTHTVLEGGEGRPKKFKRTYEKAINGDGVKTGTRGYHGRTVVFELQGNKYQVRVEGKPDLPPIDRIDLERRANTDREVLEKALMPSKPVRVGETWTVDIAAFAKDLGEGADIDLAASSGEGKLVSVQERDGKLHGVIEWNLKMMNKIFRGMKLESPAMMDIKFTFEGAIDGSSTAYTSNSTMKFAGKGLYETQGQKFTMEMNVDASERADQSAERDAAP